MGHKGASPDMIKHERRSSTKERLSVYQETRTEIHGLDISPKRLWKKMSARRLEEKINKSFDEVKDNIRYVPSSTILKLSQPHLQKLFLEDLGNGNFRVNFHNHIEANRRFIGAGDLVPNNEDMVIINGTLGYLSITNKGKVGYFDADNPRRYLSIYTGNIIKMPHKGTDAYSEARTQYDRTLIHKPTSDEITSAKDVYLTEVKKEEKAEEEALGMFVIELQKIGIDIENLENIKSDTIGISPDMRKNLQKAFLEMSPAQINRIRHGLGSRRLRSLMQKTKLLDIQVPASDINRSVHDNIKKFASPGFLGGVTKEEAAYIMRSILAIESNYRPFSVSPTGALGIAQMIQGNYRDGGIQGVKAFNPFNTHQSIFAAMKHLHRDYIKFNGDLDKAVAAYNGGPGHVIDAINNQENLKDWRHGLKNETANYVHKFRGIYREQRV